MVKYAKRSGKKTTKRYGTKKRAGNKMPRKQRQQRKPIRMAKRKPTAQRYKASNIRTRPMPAPVDPYASYKARMDNVKPQRRRMQNLYLDYGRQLNRQYAREDLGMPASSASGRSRGLSSRGAAAKTFLSEIIGRVSNQTVSLYLSKSFKLWELLDNKSYQEPSDFETKMRDLLPDTIFNETTFPVDSFLLKPELYVKSLSTHNNTSTRREDLSGLFQLTWSNKFNMSYETYRLMAPIFISPISDADQHLAHIFQNVPVFNTSLQKSFFLKNESAGWSSFLNYYKQTLLSFQVSLIDDTFNSEFRHLVLTSDTLWGDNTAYKLLKIPLSASEAEKKILLTKEGVGEKAMDSLLAKLVDAPFVSHMCHSLVDCDRSYYVGFLRDLFSLSLTLKTSSGSLLGNFLAKYSDPNDLTVDKKLFYNFSKLLDLKLLSLQEIKGVDHKIYGYNTMACIVNTKPLNCDLKYDFVMDLSKFKTFLNQFKDRPNAYSLLTPKFRCFVEKHLTDHVNKLGLIRYQVKCNTAT